MKFSPPRRWLASGNLKIGPCGAQPWQGQISELPADNGRLGDAALPICLARTVASERNQLRTDSDDRFASEADPVASDASRPRFDAALE
jgi:hypothetical protein